MRKLTTALAAASILALALPALAQQGSGPMGGQMRGPGGQQGGPQGDGQQGQGKGQGPSPEQFQQMKIKMLEHHQKRAAIIQQGQTCIQSASAAEQLKTCIQQERQAEKQLHQQMEMERGNRQQGGGGKGAGREEDD